MRRSMLLAGNLGDSPVRILERASGADAQNWLGAQTPANAHGAADASAGRREAALRSTKCEGGTTASRRSCAADASQVHSAKSVFAPVPGRAPAQRTRENHRASAADSRKQARGRSENARTPKRQGVTAIWRLPNPRDARRNMRFRNCLERRESDATRLLQGQVEKLKG